MVAAMTNIINITSADSNHPGENETRRKDISVYQSLQIGRLSIENFSRLECLDSSLSKTLLNKTKYPKGL